MHSARLPLLIVSERRLTQPTLYDAAKMPPARKVRALSHPNMGHSVKLVEVTTVNTADSDSSNRSSSSVSGKKEAMISYGNTGGQMRGHAQPLKSLEFNLKT